MSEEHSYEVIIPPHTIAEKVTHDGPDLEVLLERAEAAIAELQKDYSNWVRDDIAELERLFAEVKACKMVARRSSTTSTASFTT